MRLLFTTIIFGVLQKTVSGPNPEVSTVCPSTWTFSEQKCYLFSQEEISWYKADVICSSHGNKSYLAVPNSEAELKFILKLGNNQHRIWLGCSRIKNTNGWKCNDSEIFYENRNNNNGYWVWSNEVPSDDHSKNCVEIDEPSTRTMYNEDCGQTRSYVCEHTPVTTTTPASTASTHTQTVPTTTRSPASTASTHTSEKVPTTTLSPSSTASAHTSEKVPTTTLSPASTASTHTSETVSDSTSTNVAILATEITRKSTTDNKQNADAFANGKEDNVGAIAGSVFGVLVILCLVVLLIWLMLRRRNKDHSIDSKMDTTASKQVLNDATHVNQTYDAQVGPDTANEVVYFEVHDESREYAYASVDGRQEEPPANIDGYSYAYCVNPGGIRQSATSSVASPEEGWMDNSIYAGSGEEEDSISVSDKTKEGWVDNSIYHSDD